MKIKRLRIPRLPKIEHLVYTTNVETKNKAHLAKLLERQKQLRNRRIYIITDLL